MSTTTKTRPRRSSTSSRRAVPAALANFARFCGELRIEDGSHAQLHPFQKTILWDYFEGCRETVIILPKKNGKSTLLAALSLYHLLVTPDAECIVVASSRDQAEIILRQARMFVRKSSDLQAHVAVHRREITSLHDEGRVRVIASDEETADGVIPTLAIVDELHRHKDPNLKSVLYDGLGPRDGQLIVISTAASNLESPLGREKKRAYAVPGMKRNGKHRYARKPAFAYHEWALDPDDDTENLRVVKMANPAPWNTLAILSERKDQATEAGWLRFACGIWTEADDPWLDHQEWDALAEEGLSIPKGADVVLGVKVRGETGAVVAVARGEMLKATATVWPTLAFSDVEREVREACERWTVESVLYDPRAFKRSAELLELEGLPMLEFPQTAERMAQASGTLQRVIENDQLRHDGDIAFRTQVLAGVWHDSERGRFLGEDRVSRRPIDALVGLASAVHVIGVPTKPQPGVLVAWR